MKISQKTMIMLSAVWMLTACSSITPVQELPRTPPASLAAPCPDLPPASDGKLSTILENSLERSQMYYDCQSRHKALAEWAAQERQEP